MMHGGHGSLSGWHGWLENEACPQVRGRVQEYLHLGIGVPHGIGGFFTVRPHAQDSSSNDAAIGDVQECRWC